MISVCTLKKIIVRMVIQQTHLSIADIFHFFNFEYEAKSLQLPFLQMLVIRMMLKCLMVVLVVAKVLCHIFYSIFMGQKFQEPLKYQHLKSQ